MVTIYYYCILFLLPFDGNSICNGLFAFKLTENSLYNVSLSDCLFSLIFLVGGITSPYCQGPLEPCIMFSKSVHLYHPHFFKSGENLVIASVWPSTVLTAKSDSDVIFWTLYNVLKICQSLSPHFFKSGGNLVIASVCQSTVLPAKSDSDVVFCLQSYQAPRIDRSPVY